MSLAESSDGSEELCFQHIAETLMQRAWVVVPDALPAELAAALSAQVRQMTPEHFAAAGVGRSQAHTLDSSVRGDGISWIEGGTDAEKDWLAFCLRLQTFLNRRLFMGLFSFESHFAHYAPGAFYKKHRDAFLPDPTQRGARRILSLVAYLNPGWQAADGGELLIYDEGSAEPVQKVLPLYATMVMFLSEQVPHEVAVAKRDRYSIAGWFRVNGSKAHRADPPR